MSIRLGSNIIAGRSPQPSLFDFKWADHIISDPQWVRADTNSWQYKIAYDAAYNHLEADIEGKEAQSETIEGIIITYYLANDGHKVCLPDQSEYLDALYNTTGVAWYYIVDTINKRFKLPRTKWGFTGIRNQTSVGSYIAAGLPNITGAFSIINHNPTGETYTGAFENSIIGDMPVAGIAGGEYWIEGWGRVTESFNASKSNPIYGNSLTVQPQATQMYLYFFVGSFTQDALINAAALSVESIAEMLDKQTATITETWDTASKTIAADMEQLDTMINAQYHPNIFESKWSDHILNDIQWLRGDTFSWQSGEVYETAYQHLVDDYNNLEAIKTIVYDNRVCVRDSSKDDNANNFYAWTNNQDGVVFTTEVDPTTSSTLYYYDKKEDGYVSFGTVIESVSFAPVPQSETIAGITVQFYLAEDGHKICLDTQIDNLITLYNKTGAAWYYVLDQENTRFKLPRKHSTQIIESVKNSDGSWYKLYADGWVEQGGNYVRNTTGTMYLTLPIEMADIEYTATMTCAVVNRTSDFTSNWTFAPYSTTQCQIYSTGTVYGKYGWEVSGQSAVDVSLLKADEKYRYFYVGKFLQSAVVNTAALDTELFNEKLDLDLANISSVSKVAIISLLMPDYSRGASISLPYTATKDGWVSGVLTAAHSENYWVKVNNYNVQNIYGETNQRVTAPFMIPVSAGDVVSTTGGTNTLRFYPCKGA